MAYRNASPDAARPAPPQRRALRWLVGTVVLLLFLAAYAVVVLNVSGQIGDSVESNLRTLPVLEDHHHRAPAAQP